MISTPELVQDKILAAKCELAGEVLRSSGELSLPASGQSMLPTVWPGDTLTIEQTNIENVGEGDIVLFARHGRLVAHRVVAKNSSQKDIHITTQGDGTAHPDAPVTHLELLGKVRHITRDGKRVEAGAHLGFSKRAIASLVQRSSSVARLVVGMHGMRQKQRKQVE